jgi:hypothetical protein
VGAQDWEGEHDKHVSILGEGSVFRLLCWGVPHIPKILVMANQMAPSKRIIYNFFLKLLWVHALTNLREAWNKQPIFFSNIISWKPLLFTSPIN